MSCVSTLLLVCSLLGDTAAVAQSPVSDTVSRDTTDSGLVDTAISLPKPLVDTTGNGLVAEHDSTGDTGSSALESPDTGTSITVKTPPPYIPHLYLTTDGINFESTESDVIDIIEEDEDDQEEEVEKLFSVMLEENPKTSGLQFIIPGGIMTTIGGIVTFLILDSFNEDSFGASFDDNRHLLIASSLLTISGAAVVTFGVRQMRIHIRWSDRYRYTLPRRSTVSSDNGKRPTVIRQSTE